MEVTGIKCPTCEDIIYSRAHHDWHQCTCQEIFINGGFEYLRIGFHGEEPERIKLEIDVTKEELYKDWNQQINKFGLIKSDKKS